MKKRLLAGALASAAVFAMLVTGTAQATHLYNYYEVEEPDYLYYIEGTGAYLLPDPDGDIFYHLGRWYRQKDGSWTMSRSLDGPWEGILAQSLPEPLAELGPDYRKTRRLGMIPYRYVAGPERKDDDLGYRYYRGKYYDDYERLGYRRRWHPHGGFWFFVAPDMDDHDWEDRHRNRGRKGRY